jgi:hypothetical protein
MKTKLLLPILATLCLTGVAFSQSPDQPRRQPEPQRDSPEARKSRPDAVRSEARRDEGRRSKLREEMRRRFEARMKDPHNSQGGSRPEFRRPPAGDRAQSPDRSPGFRPVPPELQALRDQVGRLTREVQELRAIVTARHDSSRPGLRAPYHHHRGPGPASADQRPSRHDFRKGDHRPHGDAAARGHDRPHPPGDGPKPRGDREPHGNPPPPR